MGLRWSNALARGRSCFGMVTIFITESVQRSLGASGLFTWLIDVPTIVGFVPERIRLQCAASRCNSTGASDLARKAPHVNVQSANSKLSWQTTTHAVPEWKWMSLTVTSNGSGKVRIRGEAPRLYT